jgi:FeS assembly protein IscX
MPAGKTFGWLEVQRIAEELADRHRGVDPYSTRFVQLRGMVEALPGFHEEPGHPVNEKILETIQGLWKDEMEGLADDDDDE